MSDENKMFSQEELNSIISDRLNKEKGKYEQQISELTAKNASYEQQIATFTAQLEEANKKATTHESEIKERDEMIHNYETQSVKMRVAHETGIPYELAMRLTGNNEDEIKQDAESIKVLLNQTKPLQPLMMAETKPENELEAAYRFLAKRE